MIDLRPHELEIVKDILNRHVPDRKVVAFGSRAKWTAKSSSDLDLCVIGDKPMTLQEMAKLEEAFSQSDLPMKVDVVDWTSITEKFQQIIEKDAVEIHHPVNKWRSARLGDICVNKTGVQTGPFGSQLHQKDYVEVGTPIITVEHLGDNRITHQNLPQVTDTDRERLKKYSLLPGDIVFSRVGSVDRRALVREQEAGWLFSGRCLRVRVDPSLADPAFISFQFGMESFKEYMRSIAVGATMPSLNTQILSDVQITLPPLPEQKAIAAVLSALDDKIELNRRMNETLEAMVKALFKSWFVDFDPVRAKTEGRPPEGLAPEIAALFSEGFEESVLGEIPRGWGVSPIGEMVSAVGGGTPSTTELSYWNEPKHFWATPKDLSNLNSPILTATERRISDAGLAKISSGLLPEGSVLLSSRAPIGYVAIADIPVAINQGFIGMVCDKDVPNTYIWQWVLQNLDTIKSHANGSTFLEVSKASFRPILAIKPEPKILKVFSEAITPILERITASVIQSENLSKIRDSLLPKLMSGEIRVKDAEKAVEAAV